jgi:putative DNA primase/helicase
MKVHLGSRIDKVPCALLRPICGGSDDGSEPYIVAVTKVARGHWFQILPVLEPRLRPACDQLGRHVPCPVHGGTDGFRLFPDAAETGGGVCNTCGTFPDGFKVLGWATGRPLSEIVSAVANACTDNSTEPGHGNQAEAPEERIDTPEERERRRRKIEMTWSEAVPDPGRIAQYLSHRGLSGRVPEVLRFHRALGYFERGVNGHLHHLGDLPAMVAPVQSADGEIVALHRTYLDPSGPGKRWSRR